MVREVHEETGLDVVIGETARVYSYHQRNTWRHGRRADAHALRIVYDGWVPLDSPEPHVVEVDGSTMEAAWQPVADVLDGTVPVVAPGDRGARRAPAVPAAARRRRTPWSCGTAPPVRRCCSPATPRAARTRAGGRCPAVASTTARSRGRRWSARSARRPASTCTPGEVLDVGSTHFEGTAPSGRREDFHALQIVFDATVAAGEPAVLEVDGTTDAAAWVPVATLGDDRRTGPRRGPVGARGPRSVG